MEFAVELAAASRRAREAALGVPAVNYTPRERTPLRHEDIAAVMRSLEKGLGRPWADLADQMQRTDGHLAGVRENVLVAISGADLRVEPAEYGEDAALAAAGAELVLREFHECAYFPRLVDHFANASLLGWAVADHRWRRVAYRDTWRWSSAPEIVQARDVEFIENITLRLRLYDDRGHQRGWALAPLRRAAQDHEVDPSRLMVLFGSRAGSMPHISGDLLTCRWPWYFKHRLEVLRQKGFAKFASPVPYAVFGPEAPRVARDEMDSVLRALSRGEPVAVERGIEIKAWGAEGADSGAGSVGTSIGEAIAYLDREMTKALMGSTDNVESGEGSYARAKNQAGITIMPRYWTISDEVSRCFMHQWAAHLLRYNAHLFGGRVPPVPRVWFQLTADEQEPIPSDAIAAGLVLSRNEYRASYGLDPLSAKAGGNLPVRPQAKARTKAEDITVPDDEAPAPDATLAFPIDRRRRAYRMRGGGRR